MSYHHGRSKSLWSLHLLRTLVRLFVLWALWSTPALAAVNVSIVILPSRHEATQGFLLLLPDKPVASAILFAGGGGRVPLGRMARGEMIDTGNFLVRIRNRLAERGIAIAVVDAPSDQHTQEGMIRYFRAGPEHAIDIGAVVAHLQRIVGKPVWLVGTSRGTESAAAVGIVMGNRIGGVVLTSSISMPTPNGPSMFELPLERIRVPTLVMAHKADGCRVTPPYLAEKIVERLVGAPRRLLVMLDGGLSARSNSCEAMSAHGFYGIEPEAADAIANFITQ